MISGLNGQSCRTLFPTQLLPVMLIFFDGSVPAAGPPRYPPPDRSTCIHQLEAPETWLPVMVAFHVAVTSIPELLLFDPAMLFEMTQSRTACAASPVPRCRNRARQSSCRTYCCL